jgi:anthranilate 1,2-dioxygenase large subunit
MSHDLELGKNWREPAPDFANLYQWPTTDCSRIPFGVYHNAEAYQAEQERIFRGPVWNYLALEAEIPNPGDFRAISIGDTPVIVNRARDGSLHAFVNRCAHRGSQVQRHAYGNTKVHICCYHQWTYNLEGTLVSVPFRNGANGKGGLPPDFDPKEHCLQRLKVESFHGVIFGSFSEAAGPLLAYLDTPVAHYLARLFHKPIKILGYQRQRIFGNWKLYADNTRDPAHGGLLHMFQITFGIARLNQKGGALTDKRHLHNVSYAEQGSKQEEANESGYEQTSRGDMDIQLKDPSILEYWKEWPDDTSLSIISVFPNAVFQQIGNTLAARQIRTKSVDEFELYWVYFGYTDDNEAMARHRLRKSNLAGPGGLVSMEDGEAIELVHRAIIRDAQRHSVVEMGGRGPIVDQDSLISDVPMRGFWLNYCEMMGITAGVRG